MRAKLVNENINDIDSLFKPKTEEDIIKDLSNLTQWEKDKLLIKSSRDGLLNEVRLLIEFGADVNAKDKNGDTSLIWASYYGYEDIVKLLIGAGVNANAKNKNGSTALRWAYENNQKNIIELLKKYGAKYKYES